MDAASAPSSSQPSSVPSCLIIGCGYVGTRLARQMATRQRPTLAVVRSGPSETSLQQLGIHTMRLDFDGNSESVLQESLAAAAHGSAIVYLVPPPDRGSTDPRLDSFLRQLGDAVPAVVVYV